MDSDDDETKIPPSKPFRRKEGTQGATAVGAVKVNGLGKSSSDHSNMVLMASAEFRSSGKSTEERENRKSTSSNTPGSTECTAVVAEIVIDKDDLEQERDELKRQLSMERRLNADVVVASDVVPMSSNKNLMGFSIKYLLFGVVCLFLVLAGVVVGVVLGTKEDITAPTAAPTVEPFFPSTGSVIDGENQYGAFGQDTSISQDGTRLVVSDHFGAQLYSLQDHDGTGQSNWAKIGDSIMPDDCGVFADDDGDMVSSAIRSNVVVDLSRNGMYVAIGCPFADWGQQNGTIVERVGKVELYQDVNGAWELVGSPIYGPIANAHFGASVSLSGNGDQLAIGSPGSDGGVSVWVINHGDWIQFGETIEANKMLLSVGKISLSADGNIVAMSGIPLPGGDAVVQIYHLVLGIWEPMGNAIKGRFQNTSYFCDLSGNGQVVAVSNYYVGNAGPAEGASNDALDVRTFEWSETQQDWILMYQNLHTMKPGKKSGYFVSLSDDGTLMGMGDPGQRTDTGEITGHAHVYYYNGTVWIQLGPNGYGDAAGDQFGFSVALSSSGNALLVSAPFSRAKGYEHGRVVVYEIDPGLFLD